MPKQICNADATELLWKCLPQRALVSIHEKSAPGFKKAKDMLFSSFTLLSHDINIHIFDYPDSRLSRLFTLKSQRVRIIKAQLYQGLFHTFTVMLVSRAEDHHSFYWGLCYKGFHYRRISLHVQMHYTVKMRDILYNVIMQSYMY